MADQQPSSSTRKPAIQVGVVRWIVIGVLGLAALYLFRAELANLLGRAESITVGVDGIEIVATPTPLGHTIVSAVRVDSTAIPPWPSGGPRENYVDPETGFEISWPRDSDWTAFSREEIAAEWQLPVDQVHARLLLVHSQTFGGVNPMVTVGVEYIPHNSIETAMNGRVALLRSLGNEILSFKTDPRTGGAIVTYRTPEGWVGVDRFLLSNGVGYLLNVTVVPGTDERAQQVRTETQRILNSFRVGR